MRKTARLLFLFCGVLMVSLWGVETAQAAYNPKGKCRSSYRAWQGSVGWGAFVTNRRGTRCAWSRGYGSKRKAIRAAIGKCHRRNRCRVISTRAPRKQARLRTDCLRSFRQWKKKPGYRAFALARNGDYCGYSWSQTDLASARKSAMGTCKSKSGCTIYSTLVPMAVLKVRQNHLKSLDLYKGKIDGIWGRGTKRAMLTFSRWADYPNSDDDEIYDRLKWAALMTRTLDMEPKEAAKYSQRASVEKSIAFLGQDNEAARDKLFGRSLEFASAFGASIDGSKKWPYGLGKWVFSERSVSREKLEPSCLLATDGIALAHFQDTKIGTAIFLKRQDMASLVYGAKITLSKGKTVEISTRNLATMGSFLAVENPTSFFFGLTGSKFLKIEFPDRQGTVSFASVGIKLHLKNFMSCVLKSNTVAAAAPVDPGPSKGGVAQAKRGANGQYSFLVELNAEPIVMLVDTGATKVTINETMAKRIGIKLADKDFKFKVTTANGITDSAKAIAQELRIGDISVRTVELTVLRDESLVGSALLGMTFLNRLKRFEFAGDTLKLIQ